MTGGYPRWILLPCAPVCGDWPANFLLKCPDGLFDRSSTNHASCSTSSAMILCAMSYVLGSFPAVMSHTSPQDLIAHCSASKSTFNIELMSSQLSGRYASGQPACSANFLISLGRPPPSSYNLGVMASK